METRYAARRFVGAAILSLALCVPGAFAGGERAIPEKIDAKSAEPTFNSSNFQSGLRSDTTIGSLAKENSSLGDPSSSFGFAAKSEESKFFIIGALYSEAVAYLRGGKNELAAKRLESIEKEFINLKAPGSLYGFVSRVRGHIVAGRYEKPVLEEYLSLFQPFFEDYAKAKSSDKLILFRAGSWLVDMSLAASSGAKDMLRQSATLRYFQTEMKRMDAPKGVMDSLEEIAKISEKKDISDKDVDAVLKNVKKMQSLLG